MSDIPDATELLAIARATLLDKLLPRLPEDLRYDALMIANAMIIAAREHSGGNTAAQSELARLRDLFTARDEPLSGLALATELAHCNRRLVADIRKGRFDDKERAALLDHLENTAADALAISNPRALKT
jgi:hypothetical protein